MHPLIENNRETIAGLCRRHGVQKLEAFGSVLREDFDPDRSDVDMLVEFDERVAGSFANYLQLKESLEAVLGRPQHLPGAAAGRGAVKRDVDLRALRIFAATVRHGTVTAAVPGPTRLAREFLLETKAWFARHGAA